MKTKSAIRSIPALLPAAVLAGLLGFGETACGQTATPRGIDPANGLPMPDNPNATGLAPSRGTLATNSEALGARAVDPFTAPGDLWELIGYGQYAAALQLCHAFRDQNKSGWPSTMIPGWIELGRRYPQANADLIKIRDADLHEFSENRGYGDLFEEVSSINNGLRQEDSTYALFQALRENDPALAEQCYPDVEGLLATRGEYQYCYDHMGDPQRKFEGIRQALDHSLANQKRMAGLRQDSVRRLKGILQQQGQNNHWTPPPDPSDALKQGAEGGFISSTRRLIEILVATGHTSDAKKIREEAVAVLDDPRLKSAVSDAEEKVHSTPPKAMEDGHR
jgi:hypothetical protein